MTFIARPLSQFLVSILLVCAGPFAWSSPKDIPVRDFFRTPAVRNPVMSPSGKRIAILVPTEKGRVGLAVADISTPAKFSGVAQFDDADVRSVRWASDERLVFDAIDLQSGLGEQQGSGLYAVNADGSDFVWLIERTGNYRITGVPATRPLSRRHRFFATTQDGSGDVIVERYDYFDNRRVLTVSLHRLNTRTLVTRALVPFVPEGAQSWVLDREGIPRAFIAGDEKTGLTVNVRKGDSDEWEAISKFDVYDPGASSFTPLAFDHDRRLYVTARQNNPEKTTALYRFDMQRRAIEPSPVVSLKGFDFEGQFVFDGAKRALLGIHFVTDGPGSLWFDQGMKDVQAAVDKLLPNTVNRLSCTRCSQARHFIVSATSDRQSPVYFVLDKEAGKLQLIGSTRPWLDPTKLADRDFVRIKARDGMEFPVHVTKPQGRGPFPAVVLVHGGPYVRGGEWGFDADTQFLASRGFLVIEPEFRGSTGFGDTLFRAGWKQWGLKMQDDITDATRWAVAQGLADSSRMAIAGASYGGYAAMMGAVKEPSLYRAAVNWVGVTDIGLMYDIGWSDFAGSVWTRYGMPKLVGDPKSDAEQLKETSPLLRAHKIKVPVFMAYGEEDFRVPLPHGTKMRDALAAAGNKQVEWVQYAAEGHGFMLEKNKIDFWSRMEEFLKRHLK